MASISVVLPVFNRAQVVARAVESVLGQSCEDFELIVVDDGSTDGTAERVGRYADPRIRMLPLSTNLGACAARNRGILAARGEIVCLLDSDDVYRADKLAIVRAHFEGQVELDLLVDSFVCHKSAAGRRGTRVKRNPADLTGSEFRAAVFERRIAKATSALSIRRSALYDVGLFDERLRRRQDLDLVLRLARKHVCRSTDQVLWEKHESRDGISRDHRLFLQASIDVCERHPEYLSDHPAALYRDLRNHFAWLVKHGHWLGFVSDARRYARFEPFDRSLARLLLDSRVSRSAAPAGSQRSRAESGRPSKIAEASCAPARVE
ncbi:glycosyltransferase family 2 protein [Myxococcota bacterium]|nr:glycosyltransferase family 2 protein [Myxococcota bacterium]